MKGNNLEGDENSDNGNSRVEIESIDDDVDAEEEDEMMAIV